MTGSHTEIGLLTFTPDTKKPNTTITGSLPYRVALVRTRDGIEASCTCPAMADSKRGCRHLWALLLAAENAGRAFRLTWDLLEALLPSHANPTTKDFPSESGEARGPLIFRWRGRPFSAILGGIGDKADRILSQERPSKCHIP